MVNQALPGYVPVVVAGAGPIGLAVAAQLGEMGIEVLVLERNPSSMAIPRAIVLDDEGARTLQAAQISERLLPLVVEGDGPLFYDQDGSLMARVGAGPREYGFSKRYFIHQPEIEEILKQRLGEYGCASLHFNAEVLAAEQRDDEVLVTVRYDGAQRTIRTSVLLACDGARSPIREHLGIPMSGSTYEDDWLIVDALNDPDQSRNTKAFCHIDRPYMSIPAPRGGRRYEFKLMPGETRETVTTPEAVKALMAPIRSMEPQDILRVAVYSFHARIAEKLVDGRILLLGDAAHLTPPFAGQGMNAGLRDTANVAWKVAMVVRRQAPASLLQSYEIERREPIWWMIQLAMTMGEIIMPRTKHDSEVRSMIFGKLDEFPGGREFLMGMKFKPRPRYTKGVFVGLDSNVPASLVGAMVPQPDVEVNQRRHKFDDIIGPRFALLVQSAAAEQFVAAHLKMLWPELAPVAISFAPRSSAPPDIVKATVLTPDISFPLLAHRDQILLIRPDRYAAMAFWPEQAEEAVAAFRSKLAEDRGRRQAA